jgi:hypothetical protein
MPIGSNSGRTTDDVRAQPVRRHARSLGRLGPARASENRLLAACLTRPLDAATIETVLRSGIDAPALLDRARGLRVAPLVHSALKRTRTAGYLPDDVRHGLQAAYYALAARNLVLQRELAEVLGCLGEAAIPTIALKGAAVGALVYDHVALRDMRDLDLLVATHDLATAEDRLRRLGYVPDERDHPIDWYRSQHHNVPYVAVDRAVTIELHTHIVPRHSPVRLPVADLWRRARPADLLSVRALVLAPEDLLLHACVHLAYDDCFLGSLRALPDILGVAERYRDDIDWDRLATTAQAYRADRALYYGVWLTRRILRAEILDRALEAATRVTRPGRVDDLLTQRLLVRACFSHTDDRSPVPGWVLKRTCRVFLDDRRLAAKLASITLNTSRSVWRSAAKRIRARAAARDQTRSAARPSPHGNR